MAGIRRRWLPRDVRVAFWDRVRAGLPVERAAVAVGVSRASGRRWFDEAGGVISNAPKAGSGRYLSLAEREEIMILWAQEVPRAEIARRLGRDRSTIGRELDRNSTGQGYRASSAQQLSELRAKRPKPAKLAVDPVLRDRVQADLRARWSPEQITARLVRDFPDQPRMHVSHETIYQAIYVQGRGVLRRELAQCLRTGRVIRRPHRMPDGRRTRQGKIAGMVPISECPAEAADRAIPGHWEGDLIMGKDNRSAIGTLVERSTRFCLLLHLPGGKDAATVADEMIKTIQRLPAELRRSLAWDQGTEMAQHAQITLATDLDIYFCDPHSPWQRGSNENTNGLLRQYFPKGTDLATHSREDLARVAAELNGRPRKTLDWDTPAERLNKLLS
ncbi:IS30 family transposase [Amycolatopsis sp. WAC 04182]|uniref:IS30 family transposase n=1 Tax=Amycolatopsis sp. WAC 04182 TaxID=2203198 RepID=UPI001F179018|nr:IS30 family transposase [Amycolatopsis sp. WAC 04182]